MSRKYLFELKSNASRIQNAAWYCSSWVFTIQSIPSACCSMWPTCTSCCKQWRAILVSYDSLQRIWSHISEFTFTPFGLINYVVRNNFLSNSTHLTYILVSSEQDSIVPSLNLFSGITRWNNLIETLSHRPVHNCAALFTSTYWTCLCSRKVLFHEWSIHLTTRSLLPNDRVIRLTGTCRHSTCRWEDRMQELSNRPTRLTGTI